MHYICKGRSSVELYATLLNVQALKNLWKQMWE